jgi:hypothetical protein
MPHPRSLAVLAFALPLTASAALPIVPGAHIFAVAALRPLYARLAQAALVDFNHPFAAPARLPARRDLDDVVRDGVGGGATFVLGSNLAKGDVSGVKIVGLKFFF